MRNPVFRYQTPAAFVGFQCMAQAHRLPQIFAIAGSVSGRQERTGARGSTEPSSLRADGVLPRGFFFPSFQTSCSANSAPGHSLAASKGKFVFPTNTISNSIPSKTPGLSVGAFLTLSLQTTAAVSASVTQLQAKFLFLSLDDETLQGVLWLVPLRFHLRTQILP